MSHLRMPAEAVKQRRNYRPQNYLFTQSLWHCQRYVGDGMLIVEGAEIAHSMVFPPRVISMVDYGMDRGVEVRTVEYIYPGDFIPVGAIIMLTAAGTKRTLGFYGMRYHSYARGQISEARQ